MTGRLEGKTALIFGAGSIGPGWGNGKATAVLFAQEGAKTVCVDINPAAARQTVELIRHEGGTAEAATADVTKSSEVAAAVDFCLKTYGRIDVLHNNVGLPVDGDVVSLPEEKWDQLMAINLKSCFLTMKYTIPHMVKQGGGSIINISSLAALRHVGPNYVTYYAAKAGVSQMTRVTAVQYAAQQVRVNAILPGMMNTPHATNSAKVNRGLTDAQLEAAWKERVKRIPMGWMPDGREVAKAALFLASDDSRFITGIELVVDGGTSLRM